MSISHALPRFLLLIISIALAGVSAKAAVLYGKVSEINEGDVFTLTNQNRQVKIRLLGIDAPDKDQPYAEIAKQHLSDLVLNKFVAVDYSGLVLNRYILGRLFLKDLDVGAQMIRDGVAWYDASEASRLSQQEREIYVATEQAARNERRGIWQDQAPVAPWDFRRALAYKPTANPGVKSERTNQSGGLTTDDLLRAVNGAPGLNGSRRNSETYSSWRTLTPEGYNFTVLVPGNAQEQGATIPTANGKTADINLSVGSHGNASYLVIWSKGASDGAADSTVTDDTVNGFTSMLNNSMSRQGSNVDFEVQRERNLKVGSLTGSQYKLSARGATGLLRVFSKHNMHERQVYVLGVINGKENDPLVNDFLNSLKLNKDK